MSIAKRVDQLINHYNMSYNSFARSIGMSNGTAIKKMVDYDRNPQNKTLNRICETYPKISYDWLRTGEGEMTIEQSIDIFNEENLTVTAKQIIDRLEFDKGYYDNKLKEDRKHYANERQEMNDESIAKLLIGFEQLEKKVEHYAVAATTRVVKMMTEGLAEQNKMLLDGFKKIQLVESDLEDIKTFMAAKFELQKMKKKKAKQIKKLNPR